MTTSTVADRVTALMQTSPLGLPSHRARRAIRQAAGLTTTELGVIVGVTRQTVSNWEAGRREPQGDQLVAYREALLAMFGRCWPEGGSTWPA